MRSSSYTAAYTHSRTIVLWMSDCLSPFFVQATALTGKALRQQKPSLDDDYGRMPRSVRPNSVSPRGRLLRHAD